MSDKGGGEGWLFLPGASCYDFSGVFEWTCSTAGQVCDGIVPLMIQTWTSERYLADRRLCSLIKNKGLITSDVSNFDYY